MATQVLTQRVDNARSGITVHPAGSRGARLIPENVNVNSFGKLFSVKLDGDIYAQPLYVSQLDRGGTKHDVVFVVTMNNSIYAIDAASGAILNHQQVGGKPPVKRELLEGSFYRDIVGDRPTIGILSTPVIDLAAQELFLVLFTVDEAAARNAKPEEKAGHFQHILCKLDLLTLAAKGTQVIAGSVTGEGVHRSVRDFKQRPNVNPQTGVVAMTTAFLNSDTGAVVIDATGIGSHNPQVHFNSMMQLQRPGLLLLSGVLYIAFGSRGDTDPYHGWIFAYRAADLSRLDVFCTTPNGSAGGIWQAGQGLIADAEGNVYAGTGNGDSEELAGTFGTPNVGESFLKIKLVNDRLQLLGWYNAFDDQVYVPPRDPNDNALPKAKDDDLGAASPTLLPDGRIVGGGKDGYFYLIDGEQLKGDAARAQRNTQANTVVQQYFLASYNFRAGTRRVPTFLNPIFNLKLDFLDATHHIHGAPLATPTFQGFLVYVWGENDVVRAYRYAARVDGNPFSGGFIDMKPISGQPIDTGDFRHVSPVDGNEIARCTLAASNEDVKRAGMPGGFLSLSWDGQNPSTAILWASFPPFHNGNLEPVQGELVAYDATRFETQTTFSRLTALWRSRQNPEDDYGRLAKFCCPTIGDGRVYQPSGDGTLFAYGLKRPDGGKTSGGYDLSRRGQASFGGASGLTLNGTANISKAKSIVLTDNAQAGLDGVPRPFVPTFQAGSVFCTDPIGVSNLQCRFTVKLTGIDPNNMADGFTFTVQTVGPRALGSSGAGMGYAADPLDLTNTAARIPGSLALAFNIVNNTLNFWRDGVISAAKPVTDFGTHGIALNSGHALFVAVAFSDAAKTITVTVVDTSTQATTGALTIDHVDLQRFLKLGSPALAHIGFTAGTGTKNARQELIDWTVP
jgi:hypothetical protein